MNINIKRAALVFVCLGMAFSVSSFAGCRENNLLEYKGMHDNTHFFNFKADKDYDGILFYLEIEFCSLAYEDKQLNEIRQARLKSKQYISSVFNAENSLIKGSDVLLTFDCLPKEHLYMSSGVLITSEYKYFTIVGAKIERRNGSGNISSLKLNLNGLYETTVGEI